MLVLKRDSNMVSNLATVVTRENFIRHRRSLLATSLAIACFVLAGGRLTGASLLWGSVAISDTGVLYVAALLVFFYLKHEYRLAQDFSGWAVFKAELAVQLFQRERLVKALSKAGDIVINERSEAHVRLLRPGCTIAIRPGKTGVFVPLAPGLFWREFLSCLFVTIRRHKAFVEVVVPGLLWWGALLCVVLKVAFVVFDSFVLTPDAPPDLS